MAAIDYDGTTSPYSKAADVNAIKSAKMPTEVNYTGYPGDITVAEYIIFAASSTSSCTTPGTSCWTLLSSQTGLNTGGALGSSDNVVWYPNTDANGSITITGEEQKRDNYPISCVSWYGSLAFSLWLGGSLPTEAQWEYAGRHKSDGTTDNTHAYAGANENSDAGLRVVGWYGNNSGLYGGEETILTHEVGKKTATSAGLYDMSGNLYEWCIDHYGNYSNTAGSLTTVENKNLVSSNPTNNGNTSGEPLYNPIGYANSGSNRVLRGGCFHYTTRGYCSVACRFSDFPSNANAIIFGFRSVCCP
jgi:formylglycine-generating enzyme required for sulfatase activity